QILKIGFAITTRDSTQKLRAAARRAPGVRHQYGVATLSQKLTPGHRMSVERMHIGTHRATVDLQHLRVALAVSVAHGQDEQAFDLEPVERCPCQLADLAELLLARPWVQICQLTRLAPELGGEQLAVRVVLASDERDPLAVGRQAEARDRPR